MSRQRYIAVGNRWVPIEDAPAPAPAGPMIVPDLPAYTSPIDGRLIDGRAQRREDLKRSGSRPWEGLEAEKREAARAQQYAMERHDAALDRAAREAFYQHLSPSKQDMLRKRYG